MKKILIVLYIIALAGVFLTKCGGGGSAGGAGSSTGSGSCVGECRIKKVSTTNPAAARAMALRSMNQGFAMSIIGDLGNAGEYTAEFNDIEGSADEGKITKVTKDDGSYFTYVYTTFNSKPLTIKTWYNASAVVTQTTKFFYETTANVNPLLTYTDVVEYNATGTPTSYVRQCYERRSATDPWRIAWMQQYTNFNVTTLVADTASYESTFTYYAGSDDLYHAYYKLNNVFDKEFYYTKPVVVVAEEVVTEVEQTNTGAVTGLTTITTDGDGLVTTTTSLTGGDVADTTVTTNASGVTVDDTLVSTTPEVIDYDYTYEQGSDVEGNWFNNFYKEVYPFGN
jgi:hypothetical protein